MLLAAAVLALLAFYAAQPTGYVTFFQREAGNVFIEAGRIIVLNL